jgi:short-subunit dehydrogenase
MKNKIVIITGAASGIGLATSHFFSEKGSIVVMADINNTQLDKAGKDVSIYGSEVFAIHADVSKEEDCKSMIDQVIGKYKRIDVLINNAGISMRSLFQDTNLSVIKKLMNVNYWGTVYCTYYALPYLLKSKGSLVAITSLAGKHGLPGRSGYSSSKFAIQGLLETIRIENLKTGLNVLTFSPNFTATNVRRAALTGDGSPQGESPRVENNMMTAEQVASKLYRAILKRRRDVILTFYGVGTLAGNLLFPKLVDRAYYRFFSKEPGSPLKK